MKTRLNVLAGAAFAALGATWAAAAEYAVVAPPPGYVAVPGEPVVVFDARPLPGSSIHSGAVTWEDQALADHVASALYNDRRLSEPGITSTVVANNGDVTISGSADNNEQAQRAELVARHAAGPGHVYGFISSIGG